MTSLISWDQGHAVTPQYLALALACKDFEQHRQDLDNLTQQQDVKKHDPSLQ